jgi:hypothetical protein
MTTKTSNSKNKQRQKQTQIPFGDDNQERQPKTGNGKNSLLSRERVTVLGERAVL